MNGSSVVHSGTGSRHPSVSVSIPELETLEYQIMSFVLRLIQPQKRFLVGIH